MLNFGLSHMAKKRQPQPRKIRMLGIETSCDETSVALLEAQRATRNAKLQPGGAALHDARYAVRLKSHLIATQIPIHARYGGVVPEVAARTHVAEIVALLDKTLGSTRNARRATRDVRPGVTRYALHDKFDAIAVTQGPGLATALRVGVESAKTLAWAMGKTLIPVNHLEGHLASAWLVPANRKKWRFPILFLLVSGGHTELVLMTDYGKYKVLGRTRDDAAGEAFDKTAKLLGLPYPGGPHLSKLAANGDSKAFDLPRPMLHDPSLDFSFSGLKTAVRQLVESATRNAQRVTPKGTADRLETRGSALCDTRSALHDLCASIQAAIVDVLVSKTVKAALKAKPKAFAVVGGVSANLVLQKALKSALKRKCPEVAFLSPAKGLHTDNGAMIAAAGYWNVLAGKKLPRWQTLDAQPDLDL